MFIVPDVDKKVSPKPLQSVASVVETAVAALLVEWNEFCKSQLLCDALPFERIDILPVSFLRSEGWRVIDVDRSEIIKKLIHIS